MHILGKGISASEEEIDHARTLLSKVVHDKTTMKLLRMGLQEVDDKYNEMLVNEEVIRMHKELDKASGRWWESRFLGQIDPELISSTNNFLRKHGIEEKICKADMEERGQHSIMEWCTDK